MTQTQYLQWIRTNMLEQASQRYPNNPRLQMIWQIGFLESQLAHAMSNDNKVAGGFQACIERCEAGMQTV
jgi:hypothetical protein